MTVPLGTALSCQVCGVPFIKMANTQKFCQDTPCKQERSRARWAKWKAKEGSQERCNEYQRKYRQKTHSGRKWEVKSRYGLEWDDYLALLDEYNHQCALCDETQDICVDHDHKTGLVRGILCRKHNAAIGGLGDSVDAVLKAYEYLVKERC